MLVGATNKEHFLRINLFLTKLSVIPITSEISDIHLSLVKQYALSHKLQVPDAIIASTALFHDLPLFTLNKKDFKYIRGVKLA